MMMEQEFRRSLGLLYVRTWPDKPVHLVSPGKVGED
jgi:hypothetical protein